MISVSLLVNVLSAARHSAPGALPRDGRSFNPWYVVFLSACESGLHDFELADEVQSLAAAFLSAGAAGVISSMWPVFDLSAPLMAVMFYDQLLNGSDAPDALRNTQRWMRDASMSTKRSNIGAMDWIPQSARTRIDQEIQETENSFSSPVYWAPYSYSGA
jgi:CHAT domain-containing protein